MNLLTDLPAEIAQGAGEPAADTSQFVVFGVADQDYAVEIGAVREIKGWTSTTPLPRVPDHISGVINLRGVILPIVDLRTRLGIGRTEPTPRHVFVIVAVGSRLVGLLVDAVADIIDVAPDAIRPVPEIGLGGGRQLFSGIVPRDERLVTLLVLDALLAPPEATATPPDSSPEETRDAA